MSEIRIPAGTSLRTAAERLGVPVEQLQAHTDIRDVEAPLPVAKLIEVPDGFLRTRDVKQRQREARHVPQEVTPGMNMWLALDIEQKRTRTAGGMHAHDAKEDETEGLAEARRAYLRFETLSNELAIDLYRQITATHSIDVRAAAFAGLATAQAQRHRLFGEPWERLQPQALSSAKAALLADPKLGDAHLGFGLALDMGESAASDEAASELARATTLAPNDPWAHAALAAIHRRRHEPDAATQAAERALALQPLCPFALEVLGQVALAEGHAELALGLFERGASALETYANGHLGRALALRRLGKAREAQAAYDQAVALAQTDGHRQWLALAFDRDELPYI
ncbi:MAG: hypothetical protein AAB426_13040 [Myxococcota bacterium]